MELRKLDDVENNLTLLDKLKINKRYRKYASNTKLQEVDTEESKLRLENIKNTNAQKLELLKDEREQQEVALRIKQEKVSADIKYKKANAKLDQLNGIQKTGDILGVISFICVIISAFTSMVGLGTTCTDLNIQQLFESWNRYENMQYFAVGILFAIVEGYVAYLNSKKGVIDRYFNDTYNYVTTGFVAIIFTCSIFSNYQFWHNLTNSIFVSCIYAIAFDIGCMISSHYAYKFKNLDSNKFDDLQANEHVKNEDNEHVTRSSQSSENKGIGTFTQASKNEEKNTRKKASVKRYGVGKITQAQLQKMIDEFEDGQVIEPSSVNMTGNSNFRNWMPKMRDVKKNEQGKWIKQKNKFTIVKK